MEWVPGTVPHAKNTRTDQKQTCVFVSTGLFKSLNVLTFVNCLNPLLSSLETTQHSTSGLFTFHHSHSGSSFHSRRQDLNVVCFWKLFARVFR